MSTQPQQVDNNDYSAFLNEAGWGDASVEALAADMGLRRYFLLKRGDEKALLMDMSRAGILETGLAEFIKVDEFLRGININAPEIYYSNLESGLAVIEYLGDQSFGDVLKEGEDPNALYGTATDILIKLREGAGTENNLSLPNYKDTLIWERLPQFVDYYMPASGGAAPSEDAHAEYQKVWQEIETSLPEPQKIICLADYHLENLIWRDEQEPPYGIIDFQDAFWAPCAYDLLNLLHDARNTVPDDIINEMKVRYCADMNAEEKESFEAWYCLMSAQFHCRVIGLFIKFAQEGRGQQFLPHIPRLQGYLRENLKNPLLKPLKEFIEGHSISIEKTIGV
ncbi:MAG: phosphotransferase [Pseudomonadota bacterium]